MSAIQVELPDSIRAAADELAQRAGVTLDQLVASAVAEKVAALTGMDWLAARAARGDRAKFDDARSRVADIEPAPEDRL